MTAPVSVSVGEVIAARARAQGLIGGFATPAGAVRSLLAVQAQDAPLARFSIGLRTGVVDADVLAAQASGEVVRTHVLRPTWHFVHRDDLRWLLGLTAGRSVSGMGARHRQLLIDDAVRAASERVLLRELAGGVARTRAELAPLLPTTAFPRQGEVVAHLLMLAESAVLICSGPPRDNGEHTFVLVDDVIARQPALDRDEAVRRLLRRFVERHGPATLADIQKRWWPGARIAELRAAAADSGFDRWECEGSELLAAPGTASEAAAGAPAALLLPTFDELSVPFGAPTLPRLSGHPHADLRLHPSAAGGGLVVVDGRDVGTWKRALVRDRLTITLNLAPTASATDRTAAPSAAQALQRFTGAGSLEVRNP